MLFLIIRLGRIEGYRSHGAHRLADLIVAESKRGVIKLIAPAVERLESFPVRGFSGGKHPKGGFLYGK